MTLDPSTRYSSEFKPNSNRFLLDPQSPTTQHVYEQDSRNGDLAARSDDAPNAFASAIAQGKGKARALSDDGNESGVVRVTDPSSQNARFDDEAVQEQAPESTLSLAMLAPELLMRIFAFLDPISLSRCAAVCRPWAQVARDDATWRSAFATYFSLEAAQANHRTSPESAATPALRRLVGTSWRHEFQQRVDLLRQWRKSRTPTVLSTPRVDLIKKISLSKQHRFLISASDTYGVASRSNPWTGKVTKGYLDAEGTANGAGNGNPNVEFSPNVTTLNASADATNIYWGFRSGEVGMTSMSRQGMNPRGAVKSHRFSARACHAGPVSVIAIPFASDSDGAHGSGRSPERLRQAIAAMGDVATTFVTAGFDGTVRLWSSLRAWPLWIASTSSITPVSNAMSSETVAQNNAQSAAPLCALRYDAKFGVIAAGSTAGKVFVWSNIDVASLLQIPAEATDPEHLRQGNLEPETIEGQAKFAQLSKEIRTKAIEVPPGAGTEIAVSSIYIDAVAPSEIGKLADDINLLVHHSGARFLLRHHIGPEDIPVETTVLGAAVMDEITALRPDFEPRLPKRELRSSTVQSPSTSAYASPVLSATRLGSNVNTGTSSASQVPRLVLGPTPFEAYSGAGQYPERKFVCVGTRSGSVFLFDWDAQGTPFDPAAQEEWQGSVPARFTGHKQLLPSIGWEAHHTSITSLELTPLHIFVGTSDGTIKVFDSLAGDLIRTINDRTATKHPARMLAAGELTEAEAARFRVTQMIADNECLVASIGHQILAFRAEPVMSKRAAAAAGYNPTKARGSGRPRLSDNKYAMQVELKRDLRESQAELEAENEERQAEYEKIRSRQQHSHAKRGGFELEGLSEQEALEYALMLSRDAEEAQASQKAQHMGGTGYVPGSFASSSRKQIEVPLTDQPIDDPELADALEQIALAESKAEAARTYTGASTGIPSEYALSPDFYEVPKSFYDVTRRSGNASHPHTSTAPGTSASGSGNGSRRPSPSASSTHMSSNQHAQSRGGHAGSSAKYKMLEDQDFGLDFYDDEGNEDSSLDDLDLDMDTIRYLRPSPSPSPHSSPYLSGIGGGGGSSSSSPNTSRAWTILHQAGSSATTPVGSVDRWGKNSKVRTVNVPRSARISSPPTPQDMVSGSASISSSFGQAMNDGHRMPPQLASPTDFPHISPSPNPSPSPLVGSFSAASPYFKRQQSSSSPSPSLSTSIPGRVGTVAPSTTTPSSGLGKWTKSPLLKPTSMTSPSPPRMPQELANQHNPNSGVANGPSNSWTRGPPPIASSKSLLSASLKKAPPISSAESPSSSAQPIVRLEQEVSSLPEDVEDEDLKFAIQLSLAEERSRREH